MSEKTALLDSIDIYVNPSQGEGYSIGAREALALGKLAVLSDIGAHKTLLDAPGVFAYSLVWPNSGSISRIDNRVFGTQAVILVESIRASLRAAYDFITQEDTERTSAPRRRLAAEFSFANLTSAYREAIDPDSRSVHLHAPTSAPTHLTSEVTQPLGAS